MYRYMRRTSSLPSSDAETLLTAAIKLKEERIHQLGLGPQELHQLFPSLNCELAACYGARSQARMKCSNPQKALEDALRALAIEAGCKQQSCFAAEVEQAVAWFIGASKRFCNK